MDESDYNHWIKPIEFKFTEDHKPQLVVPNVLFYRGLTDGFLQKLMK